MARKYGWVRAWFATFVSRATVWCECKLPLLKVHAARTWPGSIPESHTESRSSALEAREKYTTFSVNLDHRARYLAQSGCSTIIKTVLHSYASTAVTQQQQKAFGSRYG